MRPRRHKCWQGRHQRPDPGSHRRHRRSSGCRNTGQQKSRYAAGCAAALVLRCHVGELDKGQAVREIGLESHRLDPEVVARIADREVNTQERTSLNTIISNKICIYLAKCYVDNELVGRLGRPGHQGEARQQAGPGKEPGQKPHGDAHAPRAATRNRGGVRRFRGGEVRGTGLCDRGDMFQVGMF